MHVCVYTDQTGKERRNNHRERTSLSRWVGGKARSGAGSRNGQNSLQVAAELSLEYNKDRHHPPHEPRQPGVRTCRSLTQAAFSLASSCSPPSTRPTMSSSSLVSEPWSWEKRDPSNQSPRGPENCNRLGSDMHAHTREPSSRRIKTQTCPHTHYTQKSKRTPTPPRL